MSHRFGRLACAGAFSLVGLVATSRASAADERIEIDANEPGLEVFDRTKVMMIPVRHARATTFVRSPVYTKACTSPCTTTLADGPHWLAVSKTGGALVAAPTPLAVNGDAHVDVHFEDHSGQRIAGAVLFAGSLIVGTALVAAGVSLAPKPGSFSDAAKVLLGSGVGVALFGGLAGCALVAISDTAVFTISPIVALPTRREPLDASGALAPSFDGAELTVRF